MSHVQAGSSGCFSYRSSLKPGPIRCICSLPPPPYGSWQKLWGGGREGILVVKWFILPEQTYMLALFTFLVQYLFQYETIVQIYRMKHWSHQNIVVFNGTTTLQQNKCTCISAHYHIRSFLEFRWIENEDNVNLASYNKRKYNFIFLYTVCHSKRTAVGKICYFS
jgi:hypothetical protein